MTPGTLGFVYDGVGNRVTFTRNPGTGVVTDSYAYPTTSNRLSTVTLGAGGSRAFTYDAMGDVTNEARTGGAYSYTYDSAGRMATFSIGGVLQAAYKYDFAGRQVVRSLTSPTAVTLHSVFDSDGNRIAEYNEATGALIREYVWLNGEPLAVIEGGVINYIRTDHIGRPVFATNATGTKTWTATYLPFGEIRTTTGTPIALRFPGQWFQSESGLHQNWMRDYDPTTGRYLEADPLGLVDGASVYGYAGQNPVMNSDRTGQCFGPAIALLPACVAGAMWGLGMLYDYLSDEGCYTWGDFVYSAITNNPYNPFRWMKWAKNAGRAFGGSGSGGGRGLGGGGSGAGGSGGNGGGPGAGDWGPNGQRNISDLQPIDGPGHQAPREDLRNLLDSELMDSMINPTNGDFVTTRLNEVRDGNGRVIEAQGRGLDGSIPVHDLGPPDPLAPWE